MLSLYHITKNILQCLISIYMCGERKGTFLDKIMMNVRLMIHIGLDKHLVDLEVTHVFPSKSSI